MQELRVARAKAGMTLMELQEASGVTASNISKIERGVTQPQATTLNKLARALGIEVGELYPKAPPELKESRASMNLQAGTSAEPVTITVPVADLEDIIRRAVRGEFSETEAIERAVAAGAGAAA